RPPGLPQVDIPAARPRTPLPQLGETERPDQRDYPTHRPGGKREGRCTCPLRYRCGRAEDHAANDPSNDGHGAGKQSQPSGVGWGYAPFLRGTFAPALRASDSAIAIACLRLFTFPPRPFFPLLRVPRFCRARSSLTRRVAAGPYLRFFAPLADRRLTVMRPPWCRVSLKNCRATR